MKKTYQQPELVVYGQIGELTLGSGGSKPDINNQGIVVGSGCDGTDPKIISCNVGSDP
jgi:hypothetical protein